MRTLKTILIGLVAILILYTIIALLLPSKYGITRTITINASADKIYPLIVAPKEWKKWSVWNQRDPNMEMSFSGPESGAGAAWEWKSKSQGNGGMKFTAVAPNQVVNYELHFENMGKPSSGALVIEAEGQGTKITWSMTGTSEGNFMMKLFVPFMDKLVGPDFEAGLSNLKTLVEKS